MPLYDYECRNCGHRVEVLHGVNASGPQSCERCGGAMRKLMTTPTIVFKGSGWAKKDRSTAASSAKKDDSPKPATDSSSGDGSKDKLKESSKDGSSQASSTEKSTTKATDSGSSSESSSSSASSAGSTD